MTTGSVITDTILAANTATGLGHNCDGTLSSGGHNLVGVGTDCQIGDSVTIQIAERSDSAEAIAVIQGASEVALGVADLPVFLHRSVGVQEQEPHGAPVCPAVIVLGRPDGKVADSVTVEIPYVGHVGAKSIVGVEATGEVALGVADLLVGPNRAGLSLRCRG